MSEKIPLPSFFSVQAALFEASLAILAMLAGWLAGLSPIETLRLHPQAIVLGMAAVLPLLGVLLACEHVTCWPLQGVRRVMDEVIVPMFAACSWIELAGISLLAGVGEELLFRGVLQAVAAQWTGDFLPHSPMGAVIGDWLALVGAAVVFGMLHAVNAAYAVLATLMGMYLGWLWLVSGNLLVPIVTHGLYDFVALEYMLHWRKKIQI
jgi:membrane protease YdiL (CAAX protease family)